VFIIEDYTGINGALCWDCNIIIYLFIYSAQLWAEKVSRLCTTEEAGILHYKFLCQYHFLPIDFMIPAGIHLNRLAVPCGLDSASHSIPQSSPPLLPTLQLHVWLEIKWHYFQLACVLFRFELSASDLVSCLYVKMWFVLCDSAILSDWCVYMASIFQNDLCHEPLITMCIITDLLWVEVLALCCSKTNVLFHWLREPITSVPDTRHRIPVHIISWTVLLYN
jgi:hypothetical protein